MKKTISLSIILVGFTAMASQIVLMREFLIVFYGNEVSIGFILASWLIWGAIGSWLLGRIADRVRFKITLFSLCQLLLSILLPLSILAIRFIKPILNVATGEIIAFSPMALSSFIILGPTCALLGFMFSLGCRIYETKSDVLAAKIGIVYILEAVGSMTGGLLCSFILIRLLPSLHIMAIFGLLNILAAIILQSFSKETRLKPIFVTILSIFFIVGISMWLFKDWDNLHKYSLKKQWRGYELLTSINSIYGNISVVKRDIQRSFFNNGLHLYTVPDKLTSEEAVHFALLEHPHPEEVLLVGGGVGGLLDEILKHPVKKVEYIELDPLIIKTAQEYLPRQDRASLKDIRVEVKNLDGRFFVKRTAKLYDCIIIHLGDPYTAQLNRYYTVEFFREVKRILKEDGIISFALTSSENYISPELGDFLRSIYVSLQEVFEDIKVIPGDTAYFLASPKRNILTYDYKTLMERAKERNLEIKYVREYYLFSKLSPGRISYIENYLKKKTNVKINYDFRPISYYYDIIFWTTYFKGSLFRDMFKAATEDRILKIAFGVYALILLFGLISIKTKRLLYRKATLLSVMTTGFAEISFQIVVLLSFQIIYGYVFYKLGLILTSFMIGLTLGGWWITRIMPRVKNDLVTFIWTQVSICIYPLILPLFFWWLSNSKGEVISWMGSNIFFPFLPIIAGFIGGFQFPLANKIYLAKKEEIGQVAGLSYGMDLLGSCLGALLTGTFLIPVLGIPKTCLVVAMMNFMVLMLLISCYPSFRKDETLNGRMLYGKIQNS